jgi:hypothetical protein
VYVNKVKRSGPKYNAAVCSLALIFDFVHAPIALEEKYQHIFFLFSYGHFDVIIFQN